MAEEPLDAGTAGNVDSEDPFAGSPLEGYQEDTDEIDEGQDTTDEEEGSTSDDEALIPFDQMPAEMRPHIARLTKVYQQKMGPIRQSQQKIDAYDRFMTDAAYQREFLQAAAKQLGLTIQPATGAGAKPNDRSPQPSTANTDSGRLAEELLSDEPQLQFLAPVIAKVAEAIVAQRLEPMQQREETTRKDQQKAEMDRMVADLDEAAPGWETHEDDMVALWQFFEKAAQGGPRVHPKHGSVLQLMHRLVTGDAAATARAGQRMRQAVMRRGTTSQGRQAGRVDIGKLIEEATDTESKWDLAFNEALRRNSRR